MMHLYTANIHCGQCSVALFTDLKHNIFYKFFKIIYTTNMITLIILLKTNGCKRLKMRHLKVHRTRRDKKAYAAEIKSAHFGKGQITVHPGVCYYRSGDHIVRDSVVFLSNDTTPEVLL